MNVNDVSACVPVCTVCGGLKRFKLASPVNDAGDKKPTDETDDGDCVPLSLLSCLTVIADSDEEPCRDREDMSGGEDEREDRVEREEREGTDGRLEVLISCCNVALV